MRRNSEYTNAETGSDVQEQEVIVITDNGFVRTARLAPARWSNDEPWRLAYRHTLTILAYR